MENVITLISGPPGAGKTTVARMIASHSRADAAVHLHTDDFFNAIVKGYIEPWHPESRAQNMTLTKAITASATQLAAGGFDVVIDGVIGPWFLPEYVQALANYSIDYVVLRPSADEVAHRARTRELGPLADYPPRVYDQFCDLGELEPHAIDTTQQSVHDTLKVVGAGLVSGAFRLPATNGA